MKKLELEDLQQNFMETEISSELEQLLEDNTLEDNESLWWLLISSRWAAAGPG